MDEPALAWLGIAALLCVAAAFTSLLRWAWPAGTAARSGFGCSILGGILAGIVLGPTILGRVLPAAYEGWVVGGTTERDERDRLMRTHGADEIAAAQANLPAEQLKAMRDQANRDVEAAMRTWREAQWEHQSAQRTIALSFAALVLLGGAAFTVRTGDRRQSPLTALSVGAWAAALPAAACAAAMTAWWEYAAPEAALVAAACAIGPWALSEIDREAADSAEHGGARLIQTSGRIASVIALALALWGMWSQRGVQGLWFWLPLAALPAGWGIASIGLARTATAPHASFQLITRGTIEFILTPALAALIAVRIELFDHFAIWPLIVSLVVSDDGRWLGAFIGAMLLGRRKGLRTMRLVVGSMSAGLTQLAVTAVAAATWMIPHRLLMPLLLGSLLIEVTSRARRHFAAELRRMDEEADPDQGS